MSLSSKDKFKMYASSLLAVLIWSIFPSLLKGALQGISVTEFLVIRFLISFIFFAFFSPKLWSKFKKSPISVRISFSVSVILVFFSQAYLLKAVPASWYIVVFSLSPVIFVFVFRQKLPFLALLGSFFSFLGMVLFFSPVKQSNFITLNQAILLVVSMLSWVWYSAASKNLQNDLKDIEIVGVTVFISLGASVVVWLFQGAQTSPFSLFAFVACVFLSVSMPLALLCYSYSLRKNAIFALFSQYLEPVIGLLFAGIYLGERMFYCQYIASFIIVVGTFFVAFSKETEVSECSK